MGPQLTVSNEWACGAHIDYGRAEKEFWADQREDEDASRRRGIMRRRQQPLAECKKKVDWIEMHTSYRETFQYGGIVHIVQYEQMCIGEDCAVAIRSCSACAMSNSQFFLSV